MRLEPKRFYRECAVAVLVGLMVVSTAAEASADPERIDGRADADALRAAAASTGAVIVVSDGESAEQYGSGTTRLLTADVPDGDDRFRVGSNTKMFVSTVLLQLVEEGELELDDPIGEHLPGLVTGKGIDESRITVRELLQHTSGLAENLSIDVILDPTLQWFPPTPEQMVSLGIRHGSQFDPGTQYSYSNTGYMVLGLLVEKLTGQRIGDVIDERIVEPLDLAETSYAYAGMKDIEGAHFHGYIGYPPLLLDTSRYEPGVWAGAGSLISSGSDLTAFLEALLSGKLIGADFLAQMQGTFGDTGYGLGLATADLSCGTAWGHSGHVIGYTSYTFADDEGRSVFVAVNTSSTDLTSHVDEVRRIVNSALCGAEADGRAQLSEGLMAELASAQAMAEAMVRARHLAPPAAKADR